jgi:adenylosuccinate synthase
VRRDPAATIVVRPGGTNSGHTAYTKNGCPLILRQLPAASIDCSVKVVLPAGSYIDVELLRREIAEVGLPESQLVIDPRAQIICPEDSDWEARAHLMDKIGSTGSGTGAAVLARLARGASGLPAAKSAAEVPELRSFIADATPILRDSLARGERIVIEGTQGFGLSPIHGDAWPHCTSRDTTAAAFVSESGLSPIDVDDIVLVIRCHPIRVAGESGPLPNETEWQSIGREAGAPREILELTSVTKKVRRVARFDEEVVLRAISVNAPTRIVLNHLDYVDWGARERLTEKAVRFISATEQRIGHRISLIGVGPDHLKEYESVRAEAA